MIHKQEQRSLAHVFMACKPSWVETISLYNYVIQVVYTQESRRVVTQQRTEITDNKNIICTQ